MVNMMYLIPKFYIVLSLAFFTLTADEFQYQPPENFTLSPNDIVIHHPVTTNQIAAQLYFDQGLTLCYAFNHDAAYWSFLKASEIDPKMAMASWGMALAMGANINMEITPERIHATYKMIQKALTLSSEVSQSEKDYIEALSKRYTDDEKSDQKRLAKNYSDAMRALVKKYPDDLDAATLFAESLLDINPWRQWDPQGKPLEGTLEAVSTLESVLMRDPESLGGNHYYIHAVEASPHPEWALDSANKLAKLLPSSGHIVHMPSHIYMLVGDYFRAAQSNEEAVAVDRQYIRKFGTVGIYPVHYLSHNYYVLSRAYCMQGRFSEALTSANQLEEFYAPHFHRMPEMEHYAVAPLIVLLYFHHWNEILSLPEPIKKMQGTHILWHFGRAVASAALGNLKKAEEERQLFIKEKNLLPEDLEFGLNKIGNIVKIAELVLESRIAEAENNSSKAIQLLKDAVAVQDSLIYNEPPDWLYPVRDSLGGLLLQNKLYKEAEEVFRQDLKRHPRSGRALFGLKESIKAQGRTHDFYYVDRQFQEAWKFSPIELTIKDL